MTRRQKNQNSGFVVLFTVLISVVVLAMAIGIFSISYKEIQLTASAKESNHAFNAADAGIECALYHDLKLAAFSALPLAELECFAEAVDNEQLSTTEYSFTFDTPQGGCAEVAVDKDASIDGTSYTQITALGYNVACDATTSLDSYRIVQRLLEVRYAN